MLLRMELTLGKLDKANSVLSYQPNFLLPMAKIQPKNFLFLQSQNCNSTS